MKLHFIAFGRLKAPGARDLADHYLKMLSGFAQASELELKAQPLPPREKLAPSVRGAAQEAEAKALGRELERLKVSRAGLVLLDETGKALPTLGWAGLLDGFKSRGPDRVAFCVGSSIGFSKELKSSAAALLSLGPQTFPHELARVVLFEQVYRGLSVLARHPYHHEG